MKSAFVLSLFCLLFFLSNAQTLPKTNFEPTKKEKLYQTLTDKQLVNIMEQSYRARRKSRAVSASLLVLGSVAMSFNTSENNLSDVGIVIYITGLTFEFNSWNLTARRNVSLQELTKRKVKY